MVYDRMMAGVEEAGLSQWRAELLGEAFGATLELGAGTGRNLSFYPDGVTRLVRDLNMLYRAERALHQYDFEARGFRWIDCHDSDQSVLSLIRQGDGEMLVVVLNFTPVPRPLYRIGVPQAGWYSEVVNTDSAYYGGSNLGNAGLLHTEPVSWAGFDQSLVMTLPPLAAVFFKLSME